MHAILNVITNIKKRLVNIIVVKNKYVYYSLYESAISNKTN